MRNINAAVATVWVSFASRPLYMLSQPCDLHTSNNTLRWLPVQQQLVYKAACITYKVITTSTPAYLDELLTAHISAGPTRCSSTRPLVTVPYTPSAVARWSFSFVSPTVWSNSLPSDVQSCPSQATFKRRPKTHLFDITTTTTVAYRVILTVTKSTHSYICNIIAAFEPGTSNNNKWRRWMWAIAFTSGLTAQTEVVMDIHTRNFAIIDLWYSCCCIPCIHTVTLLLYY